MPGRLRSFRVSNVARYPFSRSGPGPLFDPPEDLANDEHTVTAWRFSVQAGPVHSYADIAQGRLFKLLSARGR